MKIYVHTKSSEFPDKLMRLYGDVEVVDEHAEGGINGLLKPGEMLFMDRIPPKRFFEPSARVLVVLSRYSQKEEFLAARAGIKGFITSDIPDADLHRATRCVAAGEVWMTRKTIAKVFEEYVKLPAGKVHK
jgi:DNA-binding NarL/FixJ family response regulator